MSLHTKKFELLKRRLRDLGYRDTVDSYSSETIEALLSDLVRVSRAYQDVRRDAPPLPGLAETDPGAESRCRLRSAVRENEELNGQLLTLRQELLATEAELRRYRALADGCAEDFRKTRNLLEGENASLRSENAELRRHLAQLLRGSARPGDELRDLRPRQSVEEAGARQSEVLAEMTKQLRQTREEGAEKTKLIGLYTREIERLRGKVGYFEQLQRSLLAAEARAADQKQALEDQEERQRVAAERHRDHLPAAELIRRVDHDITKLKASLNTPDAGPAATHKGTFYRQSQPSARKSPPSRGSTPTENRQLLDLVYKLCADKDKIIAALLEKKQEKGASKAEKGIAVGESLSAIARRSATGEMQNHDASADKSRTKI